MTANPFRGRRQIYPEPNPGPRLAAAPTVAPIDPFTLVLRTLLTILERIETMSAEVDTQTSKVDTLLGLVTQLLAQHGSLSLADIQKLNDSSSKIDATITAVQSALAQPSA